MELEHLTSEIIAAAIEVHRELGPGLLEDVYEAALCQELRLRDISFQQQYRVPVFYKSQPLDKYYVLDLLVADLVVVECKSTFDDHPIFRAQVLTQLKLTNRPVGLLINFGKTTLKAGLHRVINKTSK